MIRDAVDADAPGIIALIAACWAEYPGCLMDLDHEVPELRALATYYRGRNGRVWVAEAEGAVVGSVGVAPVGRDTWEIGRMYVAAGQRGTGLARSLLARAEDQARDHGGLELRLWSDTRFTRAHRFYEKHGYIRTGESRELHDISESVEIAYCKTIPARSAFSEGEKD